MQSHFVCSALYKKERAEDKELIQTLVHNVEMQAKEISQLKQKLQSLEMNQQANKTKPTPSATTQHPEESKQRPQTINR